MKNNNMSKSKANKLARKNALIAKAESNASKVSLVEETNVSTFVKEDDSITSELNSAFKEALNKILFFTLHRQTRRLSAVISVPS